VTSENGLPRHSSIKRVILIALLIIGLFGGLLHQHASDTDCVACVLCHAGGQTSVTDLASALATPFLNIGATVWAWDEVVPTTPRVAVAVPRAPPVPSHPAMLRNGRTGPA
jgi:hypothetical protein